MGAVSKAAPAEAIEALSTMTVAAARALPPGLVILGEQCSICRMEFEDDDELRVLPCKHAEHKACLDQWLGVSKSCPLCSAEVPCAHVGEVR